MLSKKLGRLLHKMGKLLYELGRLLYELGGAGPLGLGTTLIAESELFVYAHKLLLMNSLYIRLYRLHKAANLT